MQNAVALQVKRLMGKAMFSFSFNEKVIPAIFRSATFKLSETHYTPTIKKNHYFVSKNSRKPIENIWIQKNLRIS